MDDKRVADYFIISGVPESPEASAESKQLISSALPITDITVIFRNLGEQCPVGYTCIENTPGGHPADLNNGNFKSQNIQICYRRGNDKPPLVDVGVFHEDKERVLPDVEVVYTTPYGRPASTGGNSGKSGTYITYRRAKTRCPFKQLVVVDLCVILNNKSEHPPHAFYSIRKNLNKSLYGMIGSEVFLCYKKTLLSPRSLCYTPQIISRFPLQNYSNFPLPETVPLFCLPTGANVELWPANIIPPKPVTSTFVLTSDLAQKMYGSCLTFYEQFDSSRLSGDQKSRLGFKETGDGDIEDGNKYETYAMKSICILSRWPFFECFEKFLVFLHRTVSDPRYSAGSPGSPAHPKSVPLEHHISHFLLDVSFPSPQRPTVVVQLMPGKDENVMISQPSSRLPLPLTGASFIQLLETLGVDNTMNVLLFGLSEQKILLHSLRPCVLTGVAEAISAMLFPFHWQCPYVPLCPLNLHGILHAPLPFIVGIDSRCFDTFTPPDDIICIDLDTKSIFLSEMKKCLNLRILPKRAARVLRSSLEKIFQKLLRIMQAIGNNQSPQHRLSTIEVPNKQQIERKLELEIQEAFVRFMATILRGFRSYLLPITRAPTEGATDPTSLFDFDGFLMSRDRNYNQFYQLITKTQMFTHYIEERSFVSDKDISLAFFDDCEERLSASDDIFSDRPIKLFDADDGLIQADRSVFIPAPEYSPSVSASTSLNSPTSMSSTCSSPTRVHSAKFGPLNSAYFHRHPQINTYPSLEKALNNTNFLDTDRVDAATNEISTPISICRRTKQEVKISQKKAKKSKDSPLEWSKYLVGCGHSLWFATLPSYIAYCKILHQNNHAQPDVSAKCISRILRYAFSTIDRMRKLELSPDEICFRVLTLLCGHYGQPALAVRVFFEMKKAGIKPNAITYGYYNKAVLESRWPDHSSKPTTVLWTKIRNVISGITLFKTHGRQRSQRRNMQCLMAQYTMAGDFFTHPTTIPLQRELDFHDRSGADDFRSPHRRSLVNRSFTAHQKSSIDIHDAGDSSISQNRNSIHKSYSMHLRNSSPDRASLTKTKSSSLDDEDEPLVSVRNLQPVESSRQQTAALDIFHALNERRQLLLDPDSNRLLAEKLNLIDSPAGLLFTTDPKNRRKPRSNTNNQHSPSLIATNQDAKLDLQGIGQQANFLRHADLTSPQPDHITDANEFLKANNFAEDDKILLKLDSHDHQKPMYSDFVVSGDKSIRENQRNGVPSTIEQSEAYFKQNEEETSLMQSVTSTPNFKANLSNLINDASSLQWSKWTSSQNSKSVYKGIKSAATGIVSSLQEIKSSFSISNSNTPAKLLTSAHHKSTTREMLSQWANYFYQPSRSGDDLSDDSSVSSRDLLTLSNDEEAEQSTSEGRDIRSCQRLFDALEKYYSNSSSKEDLIDHMSDLGDTDDDEVAIEVKMTSCSRCTVCHSLLYDEEIMERWSHNESNLNTRCIYCRAKIVPLMTITVDDFRFKDNGLLSKHKIPDGSTNTKDSNTLVDLDSDTEDRPESVSPKSSVSNGQHAEVTKRDSYTSEYRQIFTVPYLSPIVLRKELESVFESVGDTCPVGSQFVDEHPIIFWNLLWCFSRINAPTHLALLCLNAKSILGDKQVPNEWLSSTTVVVKTLWDNEKLHAEIGKPLYRLFERGDPSRQVQAILCDEIYFTYSFLQRVIDLIRANELNMAMCMVLNARLKSAGKFSFDKNRHNLYRDLIFLTNKALGSGKLSSETFEQEYKKAFESLNFQQVALNRFDRPPTIGSIFCRKCFKALTLED